MLCYCSKMEDKYGQNYFKTEQIIIIFFSLIWPSLKCFNVWFYLKHEVVLELQREHEQKNSVNFVSITFFNYWLLLFTNYYYYFYYFL